MLLPALRSNSLVIMDNAPFHNKSKISKLLETAGHTMLALPRYSPDFNPIEQAFAILKRQRQITGAISETSFRPILKWKHYRLPPLPVSDS